MAEVFNSVIVGFKETLRWNTIKFALIAGIIVISIWTALGIASWDILISFGAKVLEMVPFSLVRSNGSWLISTFIWFQLILITFAIIYTFFGNLILRSIDKDNYAKFSLFTIAGSALFWTIVWIVKGDYIYNGLLRMLTWLPFETIEEGVAALIGVYIIYNGIVVTMLFVASMFSGKLIKNYELREGKEVNFSVVPFRSLKYTVKDTLIFLVLSVVLFPLLFIPVVNIFIQLALWAWLIKDTITHDAISLVHQESLKEEIAKHKYAVWFITFITVLFNFLPIFNIFGPFFGILATYTLFKSDEK